MVINLYLNQPFRFRSSKLWPLQNRPHPSAPVINVTKTAKNHFPVFNAARIISFHRSPHLFWSSVQCKKTAKDLFLHFKSFNQCTHWISRSVNSPQGYIQGPGFQGTALCLRYLSTRFRVKSKKGQERKSPNQLLHGCFPWGEGHCGLSSMLWLCTRASPNEASIHGQWPRHCFLCIPCYTSISTWKHCTTWYTSMSTLKISRSSGCLGWRAPRPHNWIWSRQMPTAHLARYQVGWTFL